MTKSIKLDDLNLEVIRKKIMELHSGNCLSEYGPNIYIDEKKSQSNGDITVTEHDWRPQPYTAIDLYVECQNCNKAGYTTLRLSDDILKNSRKTHEN